jgi:hypothetical protein
LDKTTRNDDAFAKINDKEWDALSDFMRKDYKGGDDVKPENKVEGGSILGINKEKKEKAEEDGKLKLLQKIAQTGDGPISKKDPLSS